MVMKLQNESSKNISIRINVNLLKDIDDLVVSLNNETEANLSRNQLIEMMLKFAREDGEIEIEDGDIRSFNEVLDNYRRENSKIIEEDDDTFLERRAARREKLNKNTK